MSAGGNHFAAGKPFAGLSIMVTRAPHQAEPLSEMIETAGGRAIRMPVLEITAPASTARLDRIVNRLSAFDIAIFVSTNAVAFGHARIQALGASLGAMKLAAIGQKTATALEKIGRCADIYPRQGFTTEDLLTLAEMNEVRGRRIVIFRGEDGRELLGESLRARGASVVYAEVYRRVAPRGLPETLRECLANGDIDLITIASGQALHNLDMACAPTLQSRLRQTPLLVGSPGMRALAGKAGFASIEMASDPSDEAMFERLSQWARRRMPKANA